ncbi:MAG: UpxY family transcription antiterminator [Nitrospirota bacterium]
MSNEQLAWYALYVKSRHEFVTQGELGKKGIDAYLPAVKKVRQWKDRKKLVELPLFPGYCFARIAPDPEALLTVLKTRGVVSLVSTAPGAPAPVPDEEIASLKLLVESGSEFDIYPHLKEGVRVRIKRGPLRGAEGILRKKEGAYTFLVGIELLGRSVGVAVDGDDVETV